MKVNDLKGFLTEDFEPTDLIGYEDPEDKEYLSAFNLDPEKKFAEDRRVRRHQELMTYGIVKKSLPPLESKRKGARMENYRAHPAEPLPVLYNNRTSERRVNMGKNL